MDSCASCAADINGGGGCGDLPGQFQEVLNKLFKAKLRMAEAIGSWSVRSVLETEAELLSRRSGDK